MTLNEFRIEMMEYRRSADDVGRSLKDSHFALNKLGDLYARFDDSEREMANVVLAEWVISEHESIRFDALSLIGQFGVRSALPALEQLALRLAMSTDPGAPYELEKVRRIVVKLGAP